MSSLNRSSKSRNSKVILFYNYFKFLYKNLKLGIIKERIFLEKRTVLKIGAFYRKKVQRISTENRSKVIKTILAFSKEFKINLFLKNNTSEETKISK